MPPTSATRAPELGLRERKKQRTRELIAETARRLFAARGFERVTIAEVAREADVSEQTVFNYFPTKEDLVYWRFEGFEDELLTAIRRRDSGESVLRAFGRFVLRRRGLLAEQDPEARRRLLEITRMITASPALLERERAIFDRYTESLALLVAEELGPRADEVLPRVVANALMGIHRALLDYSRKRILADAPSDTIIRELRARGERAISALENGLGEVGIR